MTTPPPSWEDVAWMREQWPQLSGTPFVLKGVGRVDDAKRAVDAGVAAISVSNHGGNNLDGTPAAIRLLNPIANAVGDQVEVLMDGGVRRGSDVVKALALGARAVLIGRAYLWGLAANGQAGVENVLDVLRGGIDSALLGLGVSSVDELDPEHLLVPDGFHRLGRLGDPAAPSAAGTPMASATHRPSSERGLVLVPVGSIEQHGPHLPLDTDTTIAVAVADGVAGELPGAWVAPPLSYGSSGEHQSFAGTASIGTEALTQVAVELVRSLRTWADRVVFVNAHGGNLAAAERPPTRSSGCRARRRTSTCTPASPRPR